MLEATVAGFALGVILVRGWVKPVATAPGGGNLGIPAHAAGLGRGGLACLRAKDGRDLARIATLWLGSWGWGLLSLGVSSWWAGAVGVILLCILAGVGWAGVRASAGGASVEGFLRPGADALPDGRRSLRFRRPLGDVLAGGQTPRPALARAVAHRSPRHDVLAVPWRGVVLLRSPARLVWAVALGGGGYASYCCSTREDRLLVGGCGGGSLYLAATSPRRAVKALKLTSSAASAVLLQQRFGSVLQRRLRGSRRMMLAAGFVATTIGWIAGYVTGTTMVTMALLLIPMVFLVVLAAALSARRGGRLPRSVLLVHRWRLDGLQYDSGCPLDIRLGNLGNRRGWLSQVSWAGQARISGAGRGPCSWWSFRRFCRRVLGGSKR